jgi:hypothetical protein
VTREAIVNTWNSVGHKAGYQDNEYIGRISVVEITNQPDEGPKDNEPGADFILEETEPLLMIFIEVRYVEVYM